MKKTLIRIFGGLAVALAVGVSTASAATLASWTFETSVPTTAGPHVAEGGVNAATSEASGFHAAATTYSNPAGNGSMESFSSNGWSQNDYYQFTTSTTGYSSISFALDQTRSGTGPADFKVQADFGSGFVDVGSPYVVAATTWSSGAPVPSTYGPFSLGASADNLPLLTVRVVQLGTGIAPAGTNRVDNVTITGVPEPATMGLAICSALGLLSVRRRLA